MANERHGTQKAKSSEHKSARHEAEQEREEELEVESPKLGQPEQHESDAAKSGSFSVTPSTIDFKSDSEHVQLKVTDAGGKDVTAHVKFGSEDGSVALVTPSGLVSPVKPGECRISANAPDGSLAYVNVKVE